MSVSTDYPEDDHFLTTIRTALVPDSTAPRTRQHFPDIFASHDRTSLCERIAKRTELDYTGLAHHFAENSGPLNLQVHLAPEPADVARTIVDIVRTSQPEFGEERHIIQHNHPDILSLQLWRLLANDPVSVHTTFIDDPDIITKTKASFIGITVADWAIAESATLIQLTGPGRPRSTSLVPSIHVGVVRKKAILQSLEEAYCLLGTRNLPNSLTLISGPSKTADIEAHMVHGAHGPREMHVIIVG